MYCEYKIDREKTKVFERSYVVGVADDLGKTICQNDKAIWYEC